MGSAIMRVAQSSGTDSVYVGPERREERRRSVRNDEFEKLLGHFGLNRRNVPERRSVHSSWLLLSDVVSDNRVNRVANL